MRFSRELASSCAFYISVESEGEVLEKEERKEEMKENCRLRFYRIYSTSCFIFMGAFIIVLMRSLTEVNC